MNQFFLNQKRKREIYILIGFITEAFFFIATGWFFCLYLITLKLMFLVGWVFSFITAMNMAFIVGDCIAKNSIENHKWGF